MSGEQDNKCIEQRVCLPKPDVNNITVLTQSLPNEPILPWHRYDSPWLERDDGEAGHEADGLAETELDSSSVQSTVAQQLTLRLEESGKPPEELAS